MHATTLTALGVEWNFTPWIPPQNGTLGVLTPVDTKYVTWRGREYRLPYRVEVIKPSTQLSPYPYTSRTGFLGNIPRTGRTALFDQLDEAILVQIEAFTYDPATEALGAYLARANDMSWVATQTSDLIRMHLFQDRYQDTTDDLDTEQNALVWNTAFDNLIAALKEKR